MIDLSGRCVDAILSHVFYHYYLCRLLLIALIPPKPGYVVGITAALAGLLFGIDIGIINCRAFYPIDFHATRVEVELIVSAVLIGAFVGLC